jgi:uncharacterized iron-regulated membrane protein
MFNGLLEPYRREDGSWDWRAIQLAMAIIGHSGTERLIAGIFLLVFLVLTCLAIWLTYLSGRYLWALYTKQDMGSGPKAKAMRTLIGAWAMVLAVTIILWDGGDIGQAIVVNATGALSIAFAIAVTQMDGRKERNTLTGDSARSQSNSPPSNVPNARNFLGRRKSK